VNSVKFPEVLDQLPNDPNVRRVYGEPYVTPDGVTVIPVAKIRERSGVRGFADRRVRRSGDDARWVPAVDANRVALIGVVTGLLAAVIGSLAVLRQPPWPRITITDYR
jgi:hypothetical protein